MSDNEVVEEQGVGSGGETKKLEPGAEAAKPKPRQAETRKLAADAETEGDSQPESSSLSPVVTGKAGAHLGLTQKELTWAALAHASILVTLVLGLLTGGVVAILGVLVPAIIWYVYRDQSDYVADHARQATVFQLAGFLAFLALVIVGAVVVVVGWTISGILVVVLVGLLLLPIMALLSVVWVVAIVGLPIAQVVYGCYAALEAYNGRPFRYRWVADLIDRYQAQV